jgi:hypothetical protein
MDLEKEHKQYLIFSRIKSLNGKKNLILSGEIEENLDDIDAQISVLTNLLEML